MDKHHLLVCAECGALVERDGDKIVRSCSCPEDTEIAARLRATMKVVADMKPAAGER